VERRKLLIISYLFPPMGGIAVQRALSMAKYLPECGFDVHVLHAANAAAPVHDPGLLKHVPGEVTIHSALTLEVPFALRHWIWSIAGSKKSVSHWGVEPAPKAAKPSLPMRIAQRVLCPEPEVLWAPFATRAARRIIKRYGIECVLVTAPPFSAFLIGNALKTNIPGLKYIADFRDEWLTFYINNNDFQNNAFTRRRAAQIERQTVEAADLVIAVTESSLDEISSRYPDQPHEKFHCISNGFDPDAFSHFRPREHEGDGVLVTHVGTIYKNATPAYYFDALARLPEPIRSSFQTRFIGRLVDSERAALEAQGPSVQALGFMPQAEALRYMEDTDFLLLTMTDPISMPGKLYEYLATGKPILAVSPPGSEVDRLIRRTGAGWCADPARPGSVCEMLTNAYELTRNRDRRIGRSRDVARQFERPRLVEKYGSLIRQVVEEGMSRKPAEMAR
jgi:glycosyltransferase involved in cell wall biosynthesis